MEFASASSALRCVSTAGGMFECLPFRQPGMARSSSNSNTLTSSQHDHHLRVSWKTGGSEWWRQESSVFLSSSYSHWHPKLRQRSLPDAVIPGCTTLGGDTMKTSPPATKHLAGVSSGVRCFHWRLVNGLSSFTASTISSSSSSFSGNFLLYLSMKSSFTLSADCSSHLAGSVMASLWWKVAEAHSLYTR